MRKIIATCDVCVTEFELDDKGSKITLQLNDESLSIQNRICFHIELCSECRDRIKVQFQNAHSRSDLFRQLVKS